MPGLAVCPTSSMCLRLQRRMHHRHLTGSFGCSSHAYLRPAKCLQQSHTALSALQRDCEHSQQEHPAEHIKPPVQRRSMLSDAQPGQLVALAALGALCIAPGCQALELHAEPANALSLPTWAIHTSSVAEWVTAMALIWRYAEVTNNPTWKGMTWGMLPSLASAMAACTWHFFYNAPELDFLVAVQAFLTVVGNCTCWWAAYRIYAAAKAESPAS